MEKHRHPMPAIASPGANATVVLYQDSDGTSAPPQTPVAPYTHFRFSANFAAHGVTLYHKWGPTLDTPDGSLVTVNGSGAGESITAGFCDKPIALLPGRNHISIAAGSSAPTATSIARELNDFGGALPSS